MWRVAVVTALTEAERELLTAAAGKWFKSEGRRDAMIQRDIAPTLERILADRLSAHESEGWASYAAEQERHAETMSARNAHFEARNKMAVKVEHLEASLADMTREARLSRESTEKAVSRLDRLRDGVAHLHDVYAVAPNEPRCCSDCAANDISAELRRLLADMHEPCTCGHSEYDHSASNVSGCYLCSCGVDA